MKETLSSMVASGATIGALSATGWSVPDGRGDDAHFSMLTRVLDADSRCSNNDGSLGYVQLDGVSVADRCVTDRWFQQRICWRRPPLPIRFLRQEV